MSEALDLLEQLSAKIEALEFEVESLREALRGDAEYADEVSRLGLTRTDARLYGALRRRKIATHDQLRIAMHSEDDTWVLDSSLFSRISRLRPKLPPGWTIKTHVGLGYELVTQ